MALNKWQSEQQLHEVKPWKMYHPIHQQLQMSISHCSRATTQPILLSHCIVTSPAFNGHVFKPLIALFTCGRFLLFYWKTTYNYGYIPRNFHFASHSHLHPISTLPYALNKIENKLSLLPDIVMASFINSKWIASHSYTSQNRAV